MRPRSNQSVDRQLFIYNRTAQGQLRKPVLSNTRTETFRAVATNMLSFGEQHNVSILSFCMLACRGGIYRG